jgi:hypothetical protein
MKYILIVLFFVGFVSAGIQICIDLIEPSPPSYLQIYGKVGNISINWGHATDEPICSGIEKYVISRDGNKIGEVNENVLQFFDEEALPAGEYIYTVYAIDRIGKNTGLSIKNIVTVSQDGRVNSNLRSSLCLEQWNCTDWSECIEDMQKRTCEEISRCGTQKDKPTEDQGCEKNEENKTNELNNTILNPSQSNQGKFFSTITGNVIGAINNNKVGVTFGFVFALLFALFVVKMKRKRIK